MKTIFITFMCITLGALPVKSQNLKNDSIINDIFNSKEIVKLNNILTFTDSLLLRHTKSKSAKEAYHSYFDYFIKKNNSGRLVEPTSIEKINAQLIKLVDSIKHSNIQLFEEIWRIENGMNKKREVVSKSLAFNVKGDYFAFLKSFAKSHQRLNYYYSEHLELGGGISPHASAKYISNHRHYDFKKEIARLIAAIHLITINYEKDIKKNE